MLILLILSFFSIIIDFFHLLDQIQTNMMLFGHFLF